ncbi:hypothetical protein CAJAP_11187 [Camponotus japonicus]
MQTRPSNRDKMSMIQPIKVAATMKRERASVDALRSTRKALERDGSFDAWEVFLPLSQVTSDGKKGGIFR